MAWYVPRMEGKWEVIGIALMLLQFLAPFLILLNKPIKRNPCILMKGGARHSDHAVPGSAVADQAGVSEPSGDVDGPGGGCGHRRDVHVLLFDESEGRPAGAAAAGE
jgi:hypothetical protein